MARESDAAEVEWKILTEVESGGRTTQRSLSKKLNLALGAVNFHLKRMVRKGYIKMRAMPPNRAIYFVTPQGISRKVRLTYEYMVGTLAFYREARQRSKVLFETLKAQGANRIAFLGARDLAEICYLSLQESGLELAGIFDDSRAGEDFLGFPVRPEKELFDCPADRIVYTKQDWAGRDRYRDRPGIELIF